MPAGWILALASTLVAAPATELPNAARALVETELAVESELDAIDRMALALGRGDHRALRHALDDDGLAPHIAAWGRARLAVARGQSQDALAAYDRALAAWPDPDREAPGLRDLVRQQRWSVGLAAGDSSWSAAVLELPATGSATDRAWRGRALWATGRTEEAIAAWDQAWEAASSRERSRDVFLPRALAHLDAGEATEAAEVWSETVEVLARPADRRRAMVLWDEHPALRAAVEQPPSRVPIIRWLARQNRRPDAIAIARSGVLEAGEDAAACYAEVAEQYYRLRQHEELIDWLATPPPSGLDEEQLAELAALPWGVQRRSGPSVDIARGFDAVARDFPRTRRANEARWEAAWMWELSANPDTALTRHLEYLHAEPRGPFAKAAAARVLDLTRAQGDLPLLLARLDELQLGDGMEEATGLYWGIAAAESLGRREQAASLRERMQSDHPDSPWWRDPAVEVDGRPRVALAEVARSLFRRQLAATQTLSAHWAIDPWNPSDPVLALAARLAQLGFEEEAESALLDWVVPRRSDTEAVFRCVALAWRYGLPEMQARQGWILQRRLQDEAPEIALAGEILGWPTPYAITVLSVARLEGLPPSLLWAQMRRESFYDTHVVSLAGAHGLLQLLPSTAATLERRQGRVPPRPESLLVPDLNLRLGARYLSGLLARYGHDPVDALAAYNAGERMAEVWASRAEPGDGLVERAMRVSYTETRNYVYHLLRYQNVYRRLFPEVDGR